MLPRSLLRTQWVFLAVMIAVTLLAYLPAWRAEFIWDDEGHVTKAELRSVEGLGRIWLEPGASQQYYPVVHTVFWLEHKLWGDSPAGYHLVNLVLHALCAVLLFHILRRLGLRAAWLAAAFFALHPVQVETAAWVSELKNTLSGVWYLAAGLVYLHFDDKRTPGSYAMALVIFIFGLLSKSVIATLPAALLVIFWWRRGRIEWRRDVGPLGPFFVLGIGSGLFTAWVEHRFIGATGAEFELGVVERGLLAGRALCFYLGKLVWPAELTFIYPRWTVDQGEAWQYFFPAGVLVTATALWLWARRRAVRGPLAAFLFFAGTLFPALGFVNVYPFRYSYVADHFQYLASIGPFVLVASGFAWIEGRGRRVSRGVAAGLLVCLAVLTWRQCGIYRDMRTLWETTIRQNPGCWMAYSNLSVLSLSEGRVDEAIVQAEKALALKPEGYREAHVNLGNALFQKGDSEGAIRAYRKALEIEPAYALAWNNLGTVLLGGGRFQESVGCFDQALRLKPDFSEAECNLGNAWFQLGDPDRAGPHFKRALEINPDYAAAHAGLADVLARQGRLVESGEHYRTALVMEPRLFQALAGFGSLLLEQGRARVAIEQFKAALELVPGDARVHFNLGMAWMRLGQRSEAVMHWKKAHELAPRNPSAPNELGWLLATCPDAGGRDGRQALRFAELAVELSAGRDPAFLDTLAAAQAECGQFMEAQATVQRALELAGQQEKSDLIASLSERLELYKKRRPFRQGGAANVQ